MENCDAFIGSTEYLCTHAASVTGLRTHRFANGVGRVLGRLSDEALHRPRTAGPLRLGYLSGTSTHQEDWGHVEPAVAEVLGAHPEVELWLVGLVEPTPALARFEEARAKNAPARVDEAPWTAESHRRQLGPDEAVHALQRSQVPDQVARGGPGRHPHGGEPHPSHFER